MSKLERHEKMSGGPLMWGPNAYSEYLAGGTCRHCGAQLLGSWRKAKLKKSDVLDQRGEDFHQARINREEASKDLRRVFDAHECDPEMVKEIEQKGLKRGPVSKWEVSQ